MRVVLQRVKYASVKVDGKLINEIGIGYMLLVGIRNGEQKQDVEKIAKKISGLRIFEDENHKLNRAIKDVNGEILSISQFTLYADLKKGNRPSFVDAANKEEAINLYEYFNNLLASYDINVKTGIFGADMKIELLNDGPVTIIIDSDKM